MPEIPTGYALAFLCPGKLTAQECTNKFKAGDGVPVLATAQEAEGIMRALRNRMGPVHVMEILEGKDGTLAHLRRFDDCWTHSILSIWHLIFTPQS